MLLPFLILTYLLSSSSSSEKAGYDLPLFPDDLQNMSSWNNSRIPRNVWIAVRNSSDSKPAHTPALMARNPNWTFNFCGNDEKDNFMRTHYANTSILWAYNILNPSIGCSRPEIWRLSILYKYGGVYMDDDADIKSPFDDITGEHRRFIVGREDYDFDDRCYHDDYPLSNHSMNQRFGATNVRELLGGKFFFNWALFSSPGHPVVGRVLAHVIRLITLEYKGKSAIKMSPKDHRGKLLMCASTFPITHVVREMVLENFTLADLGLYVGGEKFSEFGGNMKAWYNDFVVPNHWVKAVKREPYLLDYAPPDVTVYEGKLIQGPGQREIFLVRNGTRHGFPDFTTFVAMGYDLGDVVAVVHKVLSLIPHGPPLPHVPEGTKGRKRRRRRRRRRG